MIVLDASAVVDAVLDRPSADWVRGQLTDVDVMAPGHQPAEILSALARLVRTGTIDDQTAAAALAEAARLPQVLIPTQAQHLRRAFALRERIRVADGLYVVLAEDLGCPLVTTDARLAGAAPPCAVRQPPGASPLS